MKNFLFQLNDTTIVLLSLSIILLTGFLMTRITKLAKLPNVTGYIIAGVLIGPYVLNLVPYEMVENMGFVSDIALAFIAFGVGRFFKKEAFKETRLGIIVITLLESLLAGIIVTLCMHYIFRLDWNFCLLLGAIATATAPASTMMTIRQYHARGNFVNTLLQVVALDDAVCLIAFSIVTAIINANIGANISPLLSCMLFGTTYINMTKDKALYKQVEKFTPPILSIFFVLSGMSLDITSFNTLGIIGAAYFIFRIAGKYLGAYLGCMITKTTKAVRNYLGLALIPQAGVAIGLAFLGKRVLPDTMGNMLLTIILSSSVLYELIGPACAKIALIYSGSIKKDKLTTNDDKIKLTVDQTQEEQNILQKSS